ncbi:STAS domain-containing protein [Spirillospora sp. NPDC047418]|jgi:anti-sigma B factor antagonist
MALTVESRFQPAAAGLAVVTLTGDLDIASAALLRGHLAAVLGQGADHLILDFTRVEFVDSTGLSVLAGVHRLLHPPEQADPGQPAAARAATADRSRRPGTLAITAVNQRVRHVLRTTGFTRIIPIYPSLETAIVVHQARSAVQEPRHHP